MIKPDTRAPLIKFLQLLVAHHPSKRLDILFSYECKRCSASFYLLICYGIRCRKGSAEILINFDDLWPSNPFLASSEEVIRLQEGDAAKNYWICGKEVPRGYWVVNLHYTLIKMITPKNFFYSVLCIRFALICCSDYIKNTLKKGNSCT